MSTRSDIERPSSQVRLTVETVGNRGDGAGLAEGHKVHVARTLPGEVVVAEVGPGDSMGRLVAIEQTSPQRIDPVCGHFSSCGGCSLQHWQEGPYLAWKSGLVAGALSATLGDAVIPVIAPAVPAWGQGRRRAVFHTDGIGRGMTLGFKEARSDQLVALQECPVLAPELTQALGPLLELARGLAPSGPALDLAVTATPAGLDVSVRPSVAGKKLAPVEPRKLARLVDEAGIARLSFDRISAITMASPELTMGGAAVELPAGAFLQATEEGERLLVEEVLAHAAGAKRIADLFCGIGTFSLPLRRLAPVLAWEVDGPAVAALQKAASLAGGGPGLKARARDLYHMPVAPAELEGVDTVVLDPPRAGARAQVEQLARIALKRVIYVSCDPASLARDAAVLIAGGYRLASVKTFDQFRFTPHVETVAVFEGPASTAGTRGAIAPLASIRRPGQGKRR